MVQAAVNTPTLRMCKRWDIIDFNTKINNSHQMDKAQISSGKSRPGTTTRAARLSRDERRGRLLACAISLFAARGFAAVNHATVAAASGVSVATMFAYFNNRELLLEAVIEEVERFYLATLASAIEIDKPAGATLLDLAEALANTVGTHSDYARILREWSVSVHENTWPKYLKHYRQMIRGLAAVIERGQREGAIRADLNSVDAAVILYSASTVLTQMMEVGESTERRDNFRRTIVQAVLQRR